MYFVKSSFALLYKKENAATGDVVCFFKAETTNGLLYTVRHTFPSQQALDVFQQETRRNLAVCDMEKLFDLDAFLNTATVNDLIDIREDTGVADVYSGPLPPEAMRRLAAR